ncbi:MAG: phosphomannomutase/phosphoglucomutase, partial [Planctomycetota bacterium]|nr:phosphomannomutase/phosphoglucomutase [Planctomycetota bacterium]
SEAIEPLRKYAQSGELNFVNDDIEATLEELREHHEDAQLSEMDGLSIDTGRWWANIRASNTEPLLRLNLEAPDPSTLEVALQELAPLLGRRESH